MIPQPRTITDEVATESEMIEQVISSKYQIEGIQTGCAVGLMTMDTEILCLKRGIAFVKRGDGSIYIENSDAVRFVEACREGRLIILGIEGFQITPNETRPVDSLVADFSSVEESVQSCDEALLFLALDETSDATHFDFTLNSKPGYSGCR